VLSLGQESGTSGSFEDFADTVAGTGRALQVLVGTNLLANFLALDSRSSVSMLSPNSAVDQGGVLVRT
jgi:hypothetical protein